MKATKSLKQKERWLSDALRAERENFYSSKLEREEDVRYVDGETPLDDEFARRLGRSISRYDIPRHNTIRRNLDWVEGYLDSQQLVASVMPVSNYHDAQTIVEKEYRKFQVKSVWNRQRFDDVMSQIIRDCVGSGEGIARVEVVRKRGGLCNKLTRRNWRGVWYDSQVMTDTFEDAKYLFDLAWQDAYVVAENHPGKKLKELIYAWSENASLDRMIDRTYNNQNPHDFYETGVDNRRQVLYGQVWWREYSKGSYETWYAPIICSQGIDEIRFLEEPRKPYKHNEFPYVRLVADRNSRSGMVYSPLTRLRRGQERFMQYPLRAIIELTSGRKAIVSNACIPKDEKGLPLYTPEKYTEIVQRYLNQPSGVLLKGQTFQKEDFQVMDNEVLIKHMIDLYTMLMGSSETTGMPIDPALLGKSSNINAAVALQEKAKHAHLSLNRITKNHVRVVRDTGTLTLANILQFEDEMDFSQWMEVDGSVGEMPAIPDYYEHARFNYEVAAKPRNTGFEEEQMKFLGEMVKLVPPQLAPSVLLIANSIMPMGNNAGMREFAKLMMQQGLPVPDSMLTPEMKQMAEQQAQASAQKQEEVEAVNMAGAKAEVDKTVSEAEKNRADAMQKVMQAHKPESGGGEKAEPSRKPNLRNVTQMLARL